MGALLTDILETKLLMPRIRPRLVRRDRLIAQLDAGLHCWLTLLSAPAGYGKTTLLVDWLRSTASESGTPRAAAWVALDEGDNDPVQFVRLLASALRPLVPEIDDTALAMAQGPQPLPLRTVLAVLINELVAAPGEIILVLEDYHVIRHPAIHDAITFLVEHLPPRLHLVVATREDPPFPLAKLRARGGLCEVRAADLRFTPDETATFLREVMALPVTPAEAAVLEARTEGWIAGLQLAALSITAGDDRAGAIADFGGNHRYFLEYLMADVLAHQPRPVQTFLMRTSVLSRLCGPLCDAVLGEESLNGGAAAMLEQIERANLFLVPLDAERQWYRYHQLFGELLRARLFRAEPDLAPDLHRRASTWYEEHGLIQEAIQHALAAHDWISAARLIEQHGLAIFYLGHLQMILSWFRVLPAELVRSLPMLSIIDAYALGVTNQGETAERCLQTAERHLHSDLPPEETAALRTRIDSLRSVMIGIRGDLTRSIALAVRTEDLVPESDVTGRMPARILAHRVMGDVRSAREHALAAIAEQAKVAGLLIAARVALGELARLHVLQGRLRRAAATFAEAERTLGPHVLTGLPGCCFGLGNVLRERNDLDEAERALNRGVESITEANIVDAYVAANGYIALARLRQARGDSPGAMAALGEFTDLARRREFTAPVTARAAATRAHLWLMQGNVAAAVHWSGNSGLSPDDQVSYLREPEYLVLARILTAKKRRTALTLLDRLLQEAEGQARWGSAIEILALRAVAFHVFGDSARALHDLERALALSEPEGYVRVFVDEGTPMATPLRQARAHGIAPEYTAGLLAAFVDQSVSSARAGSAPQGSTIAAPPQPTTPSELVEPLTKREREVLRLLMAEAPNREIARRLLITTGTVKKHIYHIFGKLGVRNRTQAAAKAKALHLN